METGVAGPEPATPAVANVLPTHSRSLLPCHDFRHCLDGRRRVEPLRVQPLDNVVAVVAVVVDRSKTHLTVIRSVAARRGPEDMALEASDALVQRERRRGFRRSIGAAH
jgi:hypothetical protein